jgi:UDP-N-acetylmuramate--alanine ligase
MSRRIHIVGIGGAGMSAIARVLHQRGDTVTGSDQARSPFSESLEREGVQVTYGHKAENVEGAEQVLASAAIPADNPELVAAGEHGVPVLHREDFWPELTGHCRTLAVAGTHGKTTTSGLLAWILEQAGESPSFIVGGDLPDFGTNARAGEGDEFVIEADEYQMAFLGLYPELAVVTNVELDHPDQFPDADALVAAFQRFVNQVTDRVILCVDDRAAAGLETGDRKRVGYGLDSRADWRAEEVRANGAGGSDFLVLHKGETLGLVRTRLPGEHNVRNTLAALAASDAVGVPFSVAREALTGFHGALRRFQVVGEADGVTVIDDYAHHPTEVAATLQAARSRYPDGEIVAVYQPHTYSRTRRFVNELAESLAAADRVIVLPIYGAREKDDPTISGRSVVDRIQGVPAEYVGGMEEAARRLMNVVGTGSVVITLSAGDGNRVGTLLLEGLGKLKRGSVHGEETQAGL